MRKQIKLIVAIILITLVVTFALQNHATVRVEFLLWSWTAPRSLVLFTVFLAGALVGWLGGAARRRH